jgi:hypothetical protein
MMGVIKLWLASDCSVPDSEIVEFLTSAVAKCQTGGFAVALSSVASLSSIAEEPAL